MESDYDRYLGNPKTLANKVLENYFGKEQPSFPIDPFKILSSFGVVFQFRKFSNIEGVYIVPEDENDTPLVGINIDSRITRQRFTAAHELCHHIKDRNTIACPIGNYDYKEQFANKFASELLMPTKYLSEVIEVYKKGKYVSFNDAIYIADYFGVSFRACINRLAWDFGVIEGKTTNTEIKRRIHEFKPEIKRISIGLGRYSICLLSNIINSYAHFFILKSTHCWYKFKNEFIYNDNRLEGVSLNQEEVAEIVTDLRVNKNQSKYCTTKNKDIIEVCGHTSMYDYILETEDKISSYKMVSLHNMLFQYSPYPECAGKTRTDNNYVLGAKFETVDHTEIMQRLINLDSVIQDLIDKIDSLSISEYIDEVLRIHYEITYIHPFHDGNGRIARCMTNWLFRIKGLPPIYINSDKKKDYFNALELIDLEGDYGELRKMTYKEVLNSAYKLHKDFI